MCWLLYWRFCIISLLLLAQEACVSYGTYIIYTYVYHTYHTIPYRVKSESWCVRVDITKKLNADAHIFT